MKIIKPGFEFITPIDGGIILKRLEECGRVCYKSEGKITDDSAPKFVAGIIKRGHEAVLEHCSFTVKFICDRGVSHEIVRHRMASYCQESTRYCNYGKDQFGSEITVVEPCYLNENTFAYDEWKEACRRAETAYFNLLNWGLSPQEARAVLPNSLKTEVVMTANIREWRHFLRLRTSTGAHPQIREIATPLLRELQQIIPICFDDILPKEADHETIWEVIRMARDECWDALKEHARQNHRERVAKNPDRIEYAIRQLEAHNIEYVLKNDATGHFHCRRKSDDALVQFWAGTGKILGYTQRGIHNLIRICEEDVNE